MIVHQVLERSEGKFRVACGKTFDVKSKTETATGNRALVNCRACVVEMENRTAGVRGSLVGTPPPQAELFPARRVES